MRPNQGMGKTDVIAVGGGLAGAAFAAEAARGGARVTVLERAAGTPQKVCGDFLSAEALDLLAYLGVDSGALGASSIGKLTLATGNAAASVALPFRAGGLSRLRLDAALLDAAAARGADVVRGVAAGSLTAEGNGVTVATNRGSFTAAAAALATGKHNLRGSPRDAGSATAFKIQAALSPGATADLANRVQLVLFDGGHVGACLVEGGVATLCWQVETNVMKRTGADWRAQVAHFAAGSPAFGELVAGARFTTAAPVAVSNLPFGYIRRAVIAPGVFPVGDQIAVIPSFTGDGTSIALASGIMAARAFLAGGTAASYQSAFVSGLRRQFMLARAVSAFLRSQATRRFAVAVVNAAPVVAASVARATRLPAAVGPVLVAQRSSNDEVGRKSRPEGGQKLAAAAPACRGRISERRALSPTTCCRGSGASRGRARGYPA